jgi:hypothetical protein
MKNNNLFLYILGYIRFKKIFIFLKTIFFNILIKIKFFMQNLKIIKIKLSKINFSNLIFYFFIEKIHIKRF